MYIFQCSNFVRPVCINENLETINKLPGYAMNVLEKSLVYKPFLSGLSGRLALFSRIGEGEEKGNKAK